MLLVAAVFLMLGVAYFSGVLGGAQGEGTANLMRMGNPLWFLE